MRIHPNIGAIAGKFIQVRSEGFYDKLGAHPIIKEWAQHLSTTEAGMLEMLLNSSSVLLADMIGRSTALRTLVSTVTEDIGPEIMTRIRREIASTPVEPAQKSAHGNLMDRCTTDRGIQQELTSAAEFMQRYTDACFRVQNVLENTTAALKASTAHRQTQMRSQS